MTTDRHKKSWLDIQREDPKFELEFQQELASQRFRDAIEELLAEQGISRADLANRLGKSRSAVTQLLRYGRNLTLDKIVELANACGYEVHPVLRPKRGFERSIVSGYTRILADWWRSERFSVYLTHGECHFVKSEHEGMPSFPPPGAGRGDRGRKSDNEFPLAV